MNASMNGEQYIWNRIPLCELVNPVQDGKGDVPSEERKSIDVRLAIGLVPPGRKSHPQVRKSQAEEYQAGFVSLR